jgi:hypothetical protein
MGFAGICGNYVMTHPNILKLIADTAKVSTKVCRIQVSLAIFGGYIPEKYQTANNNTGILG